MTTDAARAAVLERSRRELESARDLLEKLAVELDLLAKTLPSDQAKLRAHAALVQSQAALAGWVALGTRAVSAQLAVLAELPVEER